MHQRRTLRLSSVRRFVLPVGVASALATVFVAVTTAASACYPLCSIWNDSNPEWYVFFCWLC